MWYASLMVVRPTQAAKTISTSLTNSANRLEIAEMKKLILDSHVCALAIEMAQTGYRPVLDPETGEVVKEAMSEASHVDMIKFVVSKVIANAKNQEVVDDVEAHAKWASVIAADRSKALT